MVIFIKTVSFSVNGDYVRLYARPSDQTTEDGKRETSLGITGEPREWLRTVRKIGSLDYISHSIHAARVSIEG